MRLLEKLGLRRKKKTTTPDQPAYKPPVDKIKAMTLLTELRDLTVMASTHHLHLNGNLEQRRAVIVKAVREDDYGTARAKLNSLESELEDEESTRRREAEEKYEAVKDEVVKELKPLKDNPEPLTTLQGKLRQAEAEYGSKPEDATAVQVEALVEAIGGCLDKVKLARRQELRKPWDAIAHEVAEADGKLAKLVEWKDAEADQLQNARNAIEDLLAADKYNEAVKSFPGFKAGVENKFAEKQMWYEGKLSLEAEIDKKLDDLSKLNSSVAADVRKRLPGINSSAAAGEFQKALNDLTDLKVDVGKVLAAFLHHEAAMNELKPDINLAAQALSDNSINLLDQRLAYEGALRNVSQAKTLTKYTKLPDLRANLKTKLDALLIDYRENGSSPAHQSWLKSKFDQVQLLGRSKDYKVLTVPRKSPGILMLKGEFDRLFQAAAMKGEPADPSKDDVEAWELVIAKADEILAARENTDKAETRLFKKYRPIQTRVEAAEKIVETKTTALTPDESLFSDELTDFRDSWFRDKNYAEAEGLIESLRTKAEVVLQPVIAAGKELVKDIGEMPESTEEERALKRRAARAAINSGQLSQLQLESLTPEEQITLVRALRLGADMSFDENRQAQAKIYNAMTLDPSFLEAEAKGRKQVTERLLREKRDLLLEAKSLWNKKPANEEEKAKLLEKKRELLAEIVEVQCDVFDFDEPVAIEFEERDDVGDNGEFDPNTNKIVLNKNSVALNDFESALDLIVHENHHNFQFQLVDKLDQGKLPATLPPDNRPNPWYQQALLFALNMESGGYVKPEEGQGDYMKQPMEEHSWYSGPKTARGLVKELNKI